MPAAAHQVREGSPAAAGGEGIGTWTRDLLTDERRWDTALKSIFGLSAEAAPLTHAQFLQRVVPEDRSRVDRQQRRLGVDRDYLELDYRIRTPEGQPRHLRTRSWVIRDGAGKAAFVVGVAVDETGVRATQRERDDLVLRMQLAADSAGVGIWDWDLLAEKSVWNDQMYALFGRTREQFAGLIWIDVVHPDDVLMARGALAAALAAGPSFDVEFRVIWPDATVRWIASRGRVQRDAVGNAVRMIGVNWDVTHQHEAQTQLRDLIERISLTTAATGIGMWTVDLRNGDVFWDEPMRQLYGRAPNNRADLARTWHEAVHPDDRDSGLAALLAALERGEPLETDVRIVQPDGSVRTIAHRAQIQHDVTGAPLRQLGVCWDITERAQAAAALRDKQAAERASRAKSEFLSRVSHELRTPLNAILGFAQILQFDRKEPLAPGQAERVQQIMTAGKKLLVLVEDVLGLSQIESGAAALELRPTELAPVLDAAMAQIAAAAAARSITVQSSGPAVPVCVHVDARRLQQVLASLLSNAVKFNREGGRIEVRVDAPAAGRVAIRVADTGTGMDREQLANLFQPFNRLGRENQRIEGAGMGLAIAQRLVEQMGGRIEARSEPGIGSEFTVELPAPGAGGNPRSP